MKYLKILYPTDFSEASYRALHKAIEAAAPGATEICVIHIEPSFDEVLRGTPNHVAIATQRAESIGKLLAIIETRIPSTIKARPLLCQGHPALEIVRAATQEQADLIVMTTHGAGRCHAGNLGEVAFEVVRTAPCPVLTFNPDDFVGEGFGLRPLTDKH